jgi:hypothetical protein
MQRHARFDRDHVVGAQLADATSCRVTGVATDAARIVWLVI